MRRSNNNIPFIYLLNQFFNLLCTQVGRMKENLSFHASIFLGAIAENAQMDESPVDRLTLSRQHVPNWSVLLPNDPFDNVQITLTTAHDNLDFAKTQTGDIDYACKLSEILRERHGERVQFIYRAKSEDELFCTISSLGTLPRKRPLLHLLINAPHTGFMITPHKLRLFKQSGGIVVITAIEMAKHIGRQNETYLMDSTLQYLKEAHHIIYLDEDDQRVSETSALSQGLRLSKSTVIPVPCTVSLCETMPDERGKNIIMFGMIRRKKGWEHVIKLAQLIRDSNDPIMRDKKVLIVGSPCLKSDDDSLYKLMLVIYPDKKGELHGKTTEELASLHNQYKKDKVLTDLPIELHIAVPDEELRYLFSQCTYAFLPMYRGATIRNSSISSILVNQFIVYSHQGDITPDFLKVNGEYYGSIIMAESENYETYADYVFSNISERERNLALNRETQATVIRLTTDLLSADAIGDKTTDAYISAAKSALYTDLQERNYTPQLKA